MARTVILVPYRSDDGGRRDELWAFVSKWLHNNHWGWDVWLGESPSGPFNRGAAINDAARKAGDWDVAIIHDADTFLPQQQMCRAQAHVVRAGGVCYPYQSYIYLAERCSDFILAHPDGHWFIEPEHHPLFGYSTTVRHQHVSGVVVIDRESYCQVGGFIELEGWGAEDQIMHALYQTFTVGAQWRPGGAYHLWHPANRNDPADKNNVNNHAILARVQQMSTHPELLRKYLQEGGHLIP